MEVKIKKLNDKAIIPTYAKPGDAGLDFTATEVMYEEDIDCITYKTGLAVEIPEGYVGLLFPRSSICKYDLSLTNCVGVIDSGYRGEIMFKFKASKIYVDTVSPYNNQDYLEDGQFKVYATHQDIYEEISTILDIYKVGDRVGQMIILPYPKIEFKEVKELSDSERGSGGYGSSN